LGHRTSAGLEEAALLKDYPQSTCAGQGVALKDGSGINIEEAMQQKNMKADRPGLVPPTGRQGNALKKWEKGEGGGRVTDLTDCEPNQIDERHNKYYKNPLQDGPRRVAEQV